MLLWKEIWPAVRVSGGVRVTGERVSSVMYSTDENQLHPVSDQRCRLGTTLRSSSSYHEYHFPILPHQRKIFLCQILDLSTFYPKLRRSHYQGHLHARAEPIQRIVNRVPPTRLVLSRTVKRGETEGKLGEHIRSDGRKHLGYPSGGVFWGYIRRQCDSKLSQHRVTFETERRIICGA